MGAGCPKFIFLIGPIGADGGDEDSKRNGSVSGFLTTLAIAGCLERAAVGRRGTYLERDEHAQLKSRVDPERDHIIRSSYRMCLRCTQMSD